MVESLLAVVVPSPEFPVLANVREIQQYVRQARLANSPSTVFCGNGETAFLLRGVPLAARTANFSA